MTICGGFGVKFLRLGISPISFSLTVAGFLLDIIVETFNCLTNSLETSVLQEIVCSLFKNEVFVNE